MSSASIAEFKSNSINYEEEIAVRYMLIVDALPVASGFLISKLIRCTCRFIFSSVLRAIRYVN